MLPANGCLTWQLFDYIFKWVSVFIGAVAQQVFAIVLIEPFRAHTSSDRFQHLFQKLPDGKMWYVMLCHEMHLDTKMYIYIRTALLFKIEVLTVLTTYVVVLQKSFATNCYLPLIWPRRLSVLHSRNIMISKLSVRSSPTPHFIHMYLSIDDLPMPAGAWTVMMVGSAGPASGIDQHLPNISSILTLWTAPAWKDKK